MTIDKEHELHYKNMNTKIIYSDGQTNINKTNNQLSSQLVEHNKDHDIDFGSPGLVWNRHKNVSV